MATVSDIIKHLRDTLFLEQSELGALLNLSKTSIWHYENGSRMPKRSTARRIIELAKKHKINISPKDFME